MYTYNPALPRISNILRKHFNILHSSNRCKDVFKQTPFVAYRRSPNLCDILVKVQLLVISNNHFPPGSFHYDLHSSRQPLIVIYKDRFNEHRRAVDKTTNIKSKLTHYCFWTLSTSL